MADRQVHTYRSCERRPIDAVLPSIGPITTKSAVEELLAERIAREAAEAEEAAAAAAAA
jgi:hypothetical protein